jgi:putative DNA primase/helicase
MEVVADQEWRPRGSIPAGVEPGVWDELERAPDKYGKDPNTGAVDRSVVVAPGRPKPTIDNVSTILELDSRWATGVRYNLFRNVIEVHGEPLSDRKEIEILRWLDQTYMVIAPPATVHNGIIGASTSREYHPLRDYLDGARAQWDGKQRAPYWLTRYMGVTPGVLSEAIALRFLIACVARAFAELPTGTKVDTTLILIGKQGAKKSTALATLIGREWFSDSPIDLRNPKEAMTQLGGIWLHEFAELDSISPRDIGTVKSFLSAQVDRYRPAYGRNTVSVARQCAFAGTTNNEGGEFLRDPTGSRRFWPVEAGVAGDIDIAGLAEVRDQLWGEAVAMWQGDENWWLDDEEAELLADHNEHYEAADPWTGPVVKWLNGPPRVASASVDQILSDAVGVDVDKQHRGMQNRIGGIMTALGWQKRREYEPGGSRKRLWVRPSEVSK